MFMFAALATAALCLGLAWWGARVLFRPFRPAATALAQRLSPVAPFIAAGVVLFGGLAVQALGSFGMARSVDDMMNRAAGLITGPLYGGWSRPGQKAIVIVALDDAFVQEAGGVWPPPYDKTRAVIETISAAHPKAIFLDSYYRHPHVAGSGWPDVAGIAGLSEAFANARKAGTPVFIGPVAGDQPLLQPLAATAGQVGLASVGDKTFAYNLRDPDNRPMAAVQLYAAWKGRPVEHLNLPMETLSVDWGFGATDWMRSHLAAGEAFCVAEKPMARLASFLWLGWRAVAPQLNTDMEGRDRLEVSCPYFDVVSVGWLSDSEVRDRLRGKLVLVGSTVPWLRDQARTPLLGEAPGVMVHAMALDNLIQNGASATRYPNDVGETALDYADLVQAGLLLLGFMALWWIHRLGPAPDEPLSAATKARVWASVAGVGLAIACFANWPLFKLMAAALGGEIFTEAWDEFHRRRKAGGET